MVATTELSPDMFVKLCNQITSDPELPRSNPTTAFWQLPPHPTLSEIQSQTLPVTTDYAIIGSGITGCSIAQSILNHHTSKNSTVTVFEARTITSGASGRNGGVLASFVPYTFPALVEQHGEHVAIEIAKFAHNTLEKMHELGNLNEELKQAGEVRRTRDVTGFLDMEVLQRMHSAFRLLDKLVPETKLNVEFINKEDALIKYNLKNVAGALSFNAGAFWPYRLTTTMWKQLYETYGNSRLNIETRTPVLELAYSSSTSDYHYTLSTPRGLVRAKKIIHATNGYTGHLLPSLRGPIFPMRYTMSTQKAQPGFGQWGNQRTWSFFSTSAYDAKTNVYGGGTYYSCQNAKTGDIFLGGERTPADTIFSADDSEVTKMAEEEITAFLPRQFAQGFGKEEKSQVLNVWSGIEGYTPDHFPLVGRLPQSMTGRGEESGEWICAGFNGSGAAQCWTAGQAMVKMMFGEDVTGFLPKVYHLSEERVKSLLPETAVNSIFGGEWKV